MLEHEVPYLSFSGGEPMVHPHFFEMAEHFCAGNGNLKVETNGHYLTPANCERLQRLGVKAVQVSIDGASSETFNRMRVLGRFDAALDGTRNLRAAGVPIEINFSPTHFNVHEVGAAVDLAYELGAYSFYSGRTMYTGNAVKTWRKIVPSEEQYAAFFATLRAKAEEYRGRMRVYFHEMGLLEELRYRLRAPGGAGDRAAQRPREAHQRAAVRVRRPAPPVAHRDLGELPARVARSARRGLRRRARGRPAQDRRPARMDTHLSASAYAPSPLRALLHVAAMVRYRFFLYAGLVPYLLGAAWAWAIAGRFDAPIFWSGLAGVVLAVIGVEAFNEYFDARMGTDRVFDADGPQPIAMTTSGSARSPSPARSRWASTSRCAAAGRSSPSRCRRRRGDLLRGAADPLVLSRSGRGS